MAVCAAGATARAESRTPATGDEITLELEREATKARTWRYAWVGINAGSAVLSLAAIPVLPKSERPTLLVGAATAVVSGTFTWFWPLDVEADAERASEIRLWPEAQRLPRLRQLREHAADDAAERVRWPWHVGNFATALIPGAIVWFGFHEHLDGVLTAAGGFATGEIELLTQPTALADQRSVAGLGRVHVLVARGGTLLSYGLAW